MICTALFNHVRHTTFSRPAIHMSHFQPSTNRIKRFNAYPDTFRHFSNPPQNALSSCLSKSNFNLKSLNSESIHKNLQHCKRYYTNFSSSTKLLPWANDWHLHQYNSSRILSSTCYTHNVFSLRKGHLLSNNNNQHILQSSHNVPLNVIRTNMPGSTEYTRGAVNIPKLILDASPTSVKPYLEMIRFDRPIGTWLLYWPCTWSIALAAQPGCWPDFYLIALFGAGAFFMRGAGCIINDMWDKDFDNKVERTRERPLTSGKITFPQAFAFLGSQLAISLAILMQLNWYSIALGAASIGIVITYPAFKRFTYWPQVILGFAFNYGALLGWAAVRGSCDWSICLPLYFLCHMWTMVYDTIYAHQDKSDDLMVGVKSTALKFGDQTKPWLAGFTSLMAGGLLYVGNITDMTWPFYTGATITISSIVIQLYRLDINNPQACGDAFRFHFYMGLLMFVSIMLGNLAKPKLEDDEKKEDVKESFSTE